MSFLSPPKTPPTPIVADASKQRIDSLPSLIGGGTGEPIKPLTRKAETSKPSLIGGA